MGEKILENISEMLNEEKWTRATLNSYSINNFMDLDKVIKDISSAGLEDEAKELCDEHLTHTKNSIIALYIAGILSLSRQLVDDSNLIMIISIFSDNHKWPVVEYLCKRILNFGENKFALRTLAECYENENEEEKRYEVWERLIKVDYEEADLVKLLAEKYEQEENSEKAVEYYKKAIHRYINKKLFGNVRDIWLNLVETCGDDSEFFFNIEKKIARIISAERSCQLLEDLNQYYLEKKDWNTSINILKRILTYDPKNVLARKEIVDCYKEKYSYHSQLDEYIRLSNLSQSWRNIHDAIADFEKHISFDSGNFVCHRTWGIGRIRNIENDEITIDFTRKRNHSMSLKMAVNALQSLSKDHIWVLKSVLSADKLKARFKKNIAWGLKVVINSFEAGASMKMIKSELVPHILTASEWTNWSTEARKILKTNAMFGNLPDKADFFVVRDKPISYEEKTFNKFKAEKSFYSRLQTITDFLEHSDPESEFFGEMFNYFSSFVKAYAVANDNVVCSFLFIEDLITEFPYLNPGLDYNFADLLEDVEDIEPLFLSIDDADYKKKFLQKLKIIKEWPQIYMNLFPKHLSKFIIDELEFNGYDPELKELYTRILNNHREYRDAYVWIAKTLATPEWLEELKFTYEKILIGMVHILDISFREISNKRDVSPNRKINRQIQTYLFKEERIDNYFDTSDEDSITRLFSLLDDVKDLDAGLKVELRQKVLDRFPNFKFFGEVERETVSRGVLTLRESYEAKQKEMGHLLDVEIPANSKEIGAAIELGDLKENAEYKAGKEKQELLQIRLGKLKEELEKAKIYNQNENDGTTISFGVEINLINEISGKEEYYQILGPWESNPSENIISYLSPFGKEIFGAKLNDKMEFIINEREYSYTVKKINKLDL